MGRQWHRNCRAPLTKLTVTADNGALSRSDVFA